MIDDNNNDDFNIDNPLVTLANRQNNRYDTATPNFEFSNSFNTTQTFNQH